ncbi:MAG: hypothetical protein AAF621_05010 [Pseudomonadota bacterium]
MTEKNITKRKIFYISGFDPRGFRYYRELLKKAVKDFNQLEDKNITLETSNQADKHHLTLKAPEDNTENIYNFLQWDDIVRQNWEKNPVKLGLKTLKTYFLYAKHTRWTRISELPRAPVMTLFFPIFTLLSVWGGLSLFLLLIGLFLPDIPFKNLGLIIIALIPASYVLDKIKSLWLLRFFIFNARAFGSYPHLTDERVQIFKAKILESLQDDSFDEVQIVAHSNGSILLIPLFNFLLPELSEAQRQKLKVLTLGHCIPLASYYRGAKLFVERMNKVKEYNISWCDLSSPADSVCFALHDPFSLEHHPQNVRLTMKSPQFHKYYPPDMYKKMRRNKFDLHFRYFMTSPISSPYNLVALMTSSHPLEHHFMET